jgi:hypothetical protein
MTAMTRALRGVRRAWLLVPLLVPLLVACGAGGGGAGAAAAPAPTATPRPDYRAMAWRLVVPLGPLTEAVRERSPAVLARRAAFDQAAEPVLVAIQGDVSVEANRLRRAVVTIRDATGRGDAVALERERQLLLGVR